MTEHEPGKESQPDAQSSKKLGRLGVVLFSAWLDIKGVTPEERAKLIDQRYLDSLSEVEREKEYRRREELAKEEKRMQAEEFRTRRLEENRLYKENLEQPDESFDLVSWLDAREKVAKQCMVEIGYGALPYVRTKKLAQGHKYIGIEAGINPNFTESIFDKSDQHKGAVERRIKETRPDEDITFIDIDLLGEHAGTRTGLPDAIADEVLVDNVFDDPRVHSEQGLISNILLEARRLLVQDGKVVIHDSIGSGRLSSEILRIAGLRAIAVYPATHCEYEWTAMEAKFFKGDEPRRVDTLISEADYYAILVKSEDKDFEDIRYDDPIGELWYSRGALGWA